MAAIPVRDDRGAPIGELRALTANVDDATVEALTRWRTQRGEWFLTRFQPTAERTRNWIANVIARDATRRLFLLVDETGGLVGTIGLMHVDQDPVEVDNILRGERRGDPDLVFHALRAALAWAFAQADRRGANLFVLSNNERAIALYRRLGFVNKRRFALTREERQGEVRFERGDELRTATSEPHLLEMYLSRS